jgi:hypothetical protein
MFGAIAACIVLGGALAAPARSASPGTAYEEVLEALQRGRPVKVLTNADQCNYDEGGKTDAALVTGIQINEFTITPYKGISFGYLRQILDGRGDVILEDLEYNLELDDIVTITIKLRTAPGVTKETRMTCRIPTGARFFW